MLLEVGEALASWRKPESNIYSRGKKKKTQLHKRLENRFFPERMEEPDLTPVCACVLWSASTIQTMRMQSCDVWKVRGGRGGRRSDPEVDPGCGFVCMCFLTSGLK